LGIGSIKREGGIPMANSFAKIIIHYIFSTKNRQPFITTDIAPELWAYMGGIARKNKMIPLAIGGMADHAHACLIIPPTMTVSKAVQFIKGGSSLWIHEKYPNHKKFKWQEGYGAFGVGESMIDKTRVYIHHQEKHHSKISFQEEYRRLLDLYKIEYNEKFLWG
jgi:REP element-mobilizing transposase RayT